MSEVGVSGFKMFIFVIIIIINSHLLVRLSLPMVGLYPELAFTVLGVVREEGLARGAGVGAGLGTDEGPEGSISSRSKLLASSPAILLNSSTPYFPDWGGGGG
jgi:hypothetical protein